MSRPEALRVSPAPIDSAARVLDSPREPPHQNKP
jgi:hypothetical protein